MVCELFSIGYETIGLYVLLHHPNLNTVTETIYSSKSSTNHRPTTIMTLSSRFYPSNYHVLNCFVTSYFMLFVFILCLFYCHVHTKKSRVIKFWGFFMYLLFLGIVQNNTMKLDNALTPIGKLCF